MRTDASWSAPENAILPDFIICGAMKAGTTTFHKILNFHPDVFIPGPEINFFDLDDILLHPDFSFFQDGNWVKPGFNNNPGSYWEWYSSFFEGAKIGQKIGEDSTLYIASKKAISRIAIQKKAIKLIVSLRNPTDRAYSNYWHLVRTGRAIYSFEDTIRNDPYSILMRSLYLDQIRFLKEAVPEDQIFISIFEDFVTDQERTIKALSAFIGIDFDLLSGEHIQLHAHKASVPKSTKFQLWKNRIDRESANRFYANRLPYDVSSMPYKKPVFLRVLDRFHRRTNPLMMKRPPPINPATREFLDAYFREELSGLDQMVGKKVLSRWFDK